MLGDDVMEVEEALHFLQIMVGDAEGHIDEVVRIGFWLEHLDDEIEGVAQAQFVLAVVVGQLRGLVIAHSGKSLGIGMDRVACRWT